MQEQALTDWLNSPGTRVLVHCLRLRKAAALQMFLAGEPVTQVDQGRAAALHEIEELLTAPVDQLKYVFEAALKMEHKAK